VTIDSLPEDVLLEIFAFYMGRLEYGDKDVWHTLVHVCERWRNVVFSSPRRLNLQLLCIYRRPVAEMVNIWPQLPIILIDIGKPTKNGVTNLIAALQFNHRVSQIDLRNLPNSALEKFVAAMQVPFPVLTELAIWRKEANESGLVLSDEFLVGSAPRLRFLRLHGISFLGLPRLLLSTIGLVILDLEHIPHSGYIPPKEMVACLSTLTMLDKLYLGFLSPLSRPSQASRHSHPPTRTVLPALTHLQFEGVTEYLEDFVACIDAPLLQAVEITFFNQLVFDIVQLPKFLDRIDRVAVLDSATVNLCADSISITFSAQSQTVDTTWFELVVSCSKLDWQLSSLSQLCASTLSTFSNLEHLNIRECNSYLHCQDDIENIQWLELLHPFSTVKRLSLPDEVSPHVAPALQELPGERVTEVLPALEVLILNMPELSDEMVFEQFVATREIWIHYRC
jgi:hypothetical protein